MDISARKVLERSVGLRTALVALGMSVALAAGLGLLQALLDLTYRDLR